MFETKNTLENNKNKQLAMQIQNGLSRGEKQEIIITAVEKYAVENHQNWVNLAQVGAEVRAKGLKYGKLFAFLNSFSNVLEFQETYEFHTPVVSVRLKK